MISWLFIVGPHLPQIPHHLWQSLLNNSMDGPKAAKTHPVLEVIAQYCSVKQRGEAVWKLSFITKLFFAQVTDLKHTGTCLISKEL